MTKLDDCDYCTSDPGAELFKLRNLNEISPFKSSLLFHATRSPPVRCLVYFEMRNSKIEEVWPLKTQAYLPLACATCDANPRPLPEGVGVWLRSN